MDSTGTDRRTVLRASAGTLVTLTVGGCLGGPPKKKTVKMNSDFAFAPESVTIASGGTVTWKNKSKVAHTVTAYEAKLPPGADYFASGGFQSEQAAKTNMNAGLLPQDASYEHTFEQSGTYEYYCIPHESSGMVGTVEVK
jgi:plastocyanin